MCLLLELKNDDAALLIRLQNILFSTKLDFIEEKLILNYMGRCWGTFWSNFLNQLRI
jgi:hypothetical protein